MLLSGSSEIGYWQFDFTSLQSHPDMDLARVKGLKCRRDLEIDCSHISACRASDEALRLDRFPRASFRYQSGGLAGRRSFQILGHNRSRFWRKAARGEADSKRKFG
jgi:hypothetical protein